jgi:hypothetical protein
MTKARLVTEAKKIMLRDAVSAVYQGHFNLDGAHEAFPTVPKDSIRARVQLVPAGLVDSHESLGLSRAINDVCGITRRQVYTDAEQRAAAFEYKRSVDTKTRNDIKIEYGISVSALQRLGRQLLQQAGRDPSDTKLKQVSQSMHIPKPGQQRYLSEVENAIWHSRTAQRGDTGEGLSRAMMRQDAKNMVQHIGQAEQHPFKRQRLLGASCSKHWLKLSEKHAKPFLPECSFKKPSGISHKRAAAAAPELNEAMFDMIEETYKDLHAKGILRNPQPDPEQVSPALPTPTWCWKNTFVLYRKLCMSCKYCTISCVSTVRQVEFYGKYGGYCLLQGSYNMIAYKYEFLL